MNRNSKPASDSSLSRIKAIKFWHADEAAVVAERPHTLWLDKRGSASFVFKVPQYMIAPLNVEEQVNCETADKAEREFKTILDRYSEWIKTAKAEPVIILHTGYSAYEKDGKAFTNDRTHYSGGDRTDREVEVSLSYLLAFRVNNAYHQRVPLQLRTPFFTREKDEEEKARVKEHNDRERRLDMGGGFKVGSVLYRQDADNVLDYTPELHAKLDQIIEGLSEAARVLRFIDTSAVGQRAKLLLSLGSGKLLLEGKK